MRRITAPQVSPHGVQAEGTTRSSVLWTLVSTAWSEHLKGQAQFGLGWHFAGGTRGHSVICNALSHNALQNPPQALPLPY